MAEKQAQVDRLTILFLVSAIVFLLIAIPATIYFQQQSVLMVAAPDVRVSTQQMAVVAESDSALAPASVEEQPLSVVVPDGWSTYVRVLDSCGPYFEGECLRVRSGPGSEYPIVAQLRTGVVLKAGERVSGDERDWYQIEFDEWLRYPERLQGEWYVAAEFVEEVVNEGWVEMSTTTTTTGKRIVIDRSDQRLVAYDGDEVFLETIISTGIELTPTPRGVFTIFRKTPTRYMQGPLPYLAVSKYYDLPGVPWNLYFTEQGAVIHGAYWHNSFGKQYSSGCVNMIPDEAQYLYEWADLGTQVIVQD